jgi:hypothetical protein
LPKSRILLKKLLARKPFGNRLTRKPFEKRFDQKPNEAA